MKKDKFQFLFSTMNLIYELLLTGDLDNSVELLSKLTELSRYCLSEEGEMMLMDQEVQHISIFLLIQKLRFQTDSDFSIEMEGALKFRFVPRLIFLRSVMDYFYEIIEVLPPKRVVLIKFISEDVHTRMNIINTSTGLIEYSILV